DLGVELADLSTEEREGRVRGVLGRHDADQDLLGRTDARAVRDRRPENAALRLRALRRTQDERSRRGVRAARGRAEETIDLPRGHRGELRERTTDAVLLDEPEALRRTIHGEHAA